MPFLVIHQIPRNSPGFSPDCTLDVMCQPMIDRDAADKVAANKARERPHGTYLIVEVVKALEAEVSVKEVPI